MSSAVAAVMEREDLVALPARARDFERLEDVIAARVLPAAVDHRAAPVRLTWRGRTLTALPLDTRRFVQLMARHISMN